MSIYDNNIGYLGVIVLPVILYYMFKFKGKALFIYFILAITFTSGSIEALFGANPDLIRQFVEILILFLAAIVFLGASKKEIPGLPYIAGFMLVCLTSFIINDVSIIQALLFIRLFLRVFVIFILFHHIRLTQRAADNLLVFIILLYISQILVNMCKYFIVGQTELYIGSMSIRGGSLTAIFALIGICYAFSAYLYERKWKYLLLIVGFFLFSVIGNKKVMIFFVPGLLFIQYLLFWRSRRLCFISYLRKFVPVAIIILILIYAGVRLNPFLNPEGKMGGSFDPDFVVEYLDRYLYPNRSFSGAEYVGRGEAPYAVYNILREHGLLRVLVGFGPGDIIVSRLTMPDGYIHVDGSLTAMKYGVGYGARTGFLFTTLQVGVIGVVLYFLVITHMFRGAWKKYILRDTMSTIDQSLLLGLVGSYWVFVFDFLFYSRTFIGFDQILIPVFYVNFFVLRMSRVNT